MRRTATSKLSSCIEFFDVISRRLAHKHQRVNLMALELLEFVSVVYASRYMWKELNEQQFMRALLQLYRHTYFDDVS